MTAITSITVVKTVVTCGNILLIQLRYGSREKANRFQTRNQKHRPMPDNAYRQDIVSVYQERS